MKNKFPFDRKKIIWLVWLAGALALSISLGLRRIQSCNYISVDGDFQSYNVFRRMLAGQTPYVDFSNYIGMAPVWINLPLVALHNTFSGSLFVTNFTSCFLFCITALLVLWLITRSREAAMLCSILFTKLFSTGLVSTLLGRVGQYWSSLFEALYTPSNSMRIARLFLPFLIIMAAMVYLKLHRSGLDGTALQQSLTKPIFCLVLGLLAGAGIPWSNDFGLGSAFCLTVLFLLLQAIGEWSGWKNFAGRLGSYLVGLAIGAVAVIFAVTKGNPAAYLQFTRDVGEWQYFYFNGTGGKAVIPYLFTVPRLWIAMAPTLIFLVWCLVRLCRRRLTDRQLLLGYLAFTILAATGAYTVSGSGYNFKEALEGYTWLAGFALLARAILWLIRSKKKIKNSILTGGTLILSAALVLLDVRDIAGWPEQPQSGAYISGLDGYCDYTKALVELPEQTGGEPVFSVYATGLETVENRFQPTGSDYIIHALGSARREQYLSDFINGDYEFVQTPYMELENWLTAQNWDFYRILWKNYRRVSTTEYSWLWQKNGDNTVDVQADISVEQVDAATVRITVTAPEDACFTADVRVNYTTRFTSPVGAVLSLGRRMVSVGTPLFGDTNGVNCNLPAEGESFLPIRVENGKGTATLTASDPDFTALTVSEAEVVQALPAKNLLK